MSEINAVDYLKYCAAEVKARLDYVIDRLGQADDDYPLSEHESECMQSVLEGVQRTVVDACATFCRDGDDMDTYADGRPVRTRHEFERGNVYEQRWHPQPDHPDNLPHEVATFDTTSGSRKTVVVSAPGVLDAIDRSLRAVE